MSVRPLSGIRQLTPCSRSASQGIPLFRRTEN